MALWFFAFLSLASCYSNLCPQPSACVTKTIEPGEFVSVSLGVGSHFNLTCLAGIFNSTTGPVAPSRYHISLSVPVVSPCHDENTFNLKSYMGSLSKASFSQPRPSQWILSIQSLSDRPITINLGLNFKIYTPQNQPQPAKGAAYDEKLAVKLLMLSSAAYLDDPQKCPLLPHNVSVVQTFLEDMPIVGGIKANIFGFIALDHTEQQIIVVFRGTPGSTLTGVLQFLQQILTSSLVDVPAVGNEEKMVEYFLKAAEVIAFNTERHEFQNTMMLLTREYPSYQVIFTGHSLGGAIASSAAFMISLAKQRPYPLKQFYKRTNWIGDSGLLLGDNDVPLVYTFGQPRIGNYFFAQTYNQLIPFAYRIVHGEDVAPHFPKCLLTQGCGTGPFPGPFREGVQVHYPPDFQGQPAICLPEFCQDKPACSYWPSFNNPCAAHHASYFKIPVGSGCLQKAFLMK